MLTDIDPFQTLIPGDLLTDPDNPIQPSTCISAKLLVFSIQQPITKGYPVSVIIVSFVDCPYCFYCSVYLMNLASFMLVEYYSISNIISRCYCVFHR